SIRGDGPMMTSTITPKSTNNKTTPSHAEKGARVCAISRSDSGVAISVRYPQRFDQPVIAHWEKRAAREQSQINKREHSADCKEGNEIPDANVNAGAVQRRQYHNVHIEELHEHDPARHPAQLVRCFLDRAQEENGKWPEEAANHEQHVQRPP